MRQPPILMYHWFRARDVASTSQSPQLEIAPECFRAHMELLARKGYRGVTLGEALSGGRDGRGERRVAITFDDGTRDFWEHARPVLRELGYSATLFVVTGYVGGESSWDEALGEPARPLLDWDQIRTLAEEGFEIGSHTHGHRVLPELSDDEALGELRESRETLERELGTAPRYLAYPRGFFAQRHKELVAEAGYEAACGVILRWRDLRRADRYALARMTIKGTESLHRFRLRLALSRVVRLVS